MFRHGRIGVSLTTLLLLCARGAYAGPEDDQFAVAAGHYNNRRWKLAVEEFDAFLQKFPDSPRAGVIVFYSGEALVQAGEYAKATDRFAEFLRREPDHKLTKQARFRVGETAYLGGNVDAALEGLSEFRRRHPKDPMNEFALPYLGEMEFNRGRYAKAEEHYAAALGDFPNGRLADQCRLGLARASQELGNLPQAERFYHFVTQSQTARLSAEAHFRLGDLLRKQDKLDEAKDAFNIVAEKHPTSRWRNHSLYWSAWIDAERGKWDEALQTLTSIEKVDDESLAPAVAFTTGEVLRNLQRHEEAIKLYDQVVQRWPKSEWADDSLQAQAEAALRGDDVEQLKRVAEAFEDRFADSPLRALVRRAWGRSLLKRKQFAEAAKVFENLAAASEGAPAETSRSTWYYLGLAHLGLKQHEQALAAFKMARPDQGQPELRDSVDVAIASAMIAIEQYEQAVPPLQSYLKSQPAGEDAANCQAQLVFCLAKLGQVDEAAELHGQLSQSHPDHPSLDAATRALAEAAYAQGKSTLARDYFQMLTSEDAGADNAQSLSALAWLEWESGDYEPAAEKFRQLLSDYPSTKYAAEAAFMRGMALEKLGQDDGALAAYSLLVEKHRNSPQRPSAMLAAARLHQRQGQNREAAAMYEQLVGEHEDFPQADVALYEWAWTLLDQQRGQEAETLWRRLLDEHPHSKLWSDTAYRLAERASKRGENDEAKELLAKIHRSESPASDEVLSRALYLEGQVAAASGNWQDVIEPMSRVVKEFPEGALNLPAKYWVAESKYRLGEYEEAGAMFDDLSKKTGALTDAWLAMVPLRRAQVLAHQEKWAEAQAVAMTVEKRFPNFRQQYEIDYVLGRCLASQAKFTQAREAYERVVKSPAGGRTETAAMAQWMIGETFFHQKNFHEAVKAYHRVEQLYPYPRWQAAALLQAGKCYEAQQDWKEAVRLYGQLIQNFGGSDFDEEATRRLKVAQQRATQ